MLFHRILQLFCGVLHGWAALLGGWKGETARVPVIFRHCYFRYLIIMKINLKGTLKIISLKHQHNKDCLGIWGEVFVASHMLFHDFFWTIDIFGDQVALDWMNGSLTCYKQRLGWWMMIRMHYRAMLLSHKKVEFFFYPNSSNDNLTNTVPSLKWAVCPAWNHGPFPFGCQGGLDFSGINYTTGCYHTSHNHGSVDKWCISNMNSFLSFRGIFH